MSKSLQELAKDGDVKALEALMNKSFNSRGVEVRVTNSGSLLRINLRSKTAPPASLAVQIKKGLVSIAPRGFEKVFVIAEVIGGSNAWSQQWSLNPTINVSGNPPQPAAIASTNSSIDSPKWYQRSWLVILLLILFPLAGIPLTWTSRWSRNRKIVASVLGGAWLLFTLVPKSEEVATSGNESHRTTTETIQEQDSEYDLDDFVEFDGRAIIAKKVSKVNEISVDNQFTEPISGEIILVEFSVKNTSNESGSLYFSQFKLIDSQGREYDELTDSTYSMWRDDNGFASRGEDYYPGEVRRDVAAFRVAPGASGFKLEWKGKLINLSQ